MRWVLCIVAVDPISLWQLAKLFLLIHPYIIDEILHREGGIIYRSTIITAQGKIEQEILRLLERLLVIAQLAIYRLILANLIQKFIIQVKTDALLIPIHAPNVELISPLRIPISEMGERDSLAVPFRRPRLIGSPAGIGKDMRALPACDNTPSCRFLHSTASPCHDLEARWQARIRQP